MTENTPTKTGRPAKWDHLIPEMIRLYTEEKMSRNQISKQLNISVQTITRKLELAGVKFENRMSNTRKPLSEEHKKSISKGRIGKGIGIRSPNKQIRACEFCTNEYQPNDAKQRFCDTQCRDNFNRWESQAQARINWIENPKSMCLCGKRIPFASRHVRKYCSDECTKLYGLKKQKDPENYVTFNCETCENEVTRYKNYGSGASRFCSNECSAKSYNVKARIDDVVLDSGWEALFWGLCKFLKIPIERVDRSQAVSFDGKTYAPDFFLPTENIYIEIKGMLDDDDIDRWQNWKNHHMAHLVILNWDKLDSIRRKENSSDFIKELIFMKFG